MQSVEPAKKSLPQVFLCPTSSTQCQGPIRRLLSCADDSSGSPRIQGVDSNLFQQIDSDSIIFDIDSKKKNFFFFNFFFSS